MLTMTFCCFVLSTGLVFVRSCSIGSDRIFLTGLSELCLAAVLSSWFSWSVLRRRVVLGPCRFIIIIIIIYVYYVYVSDLADLVE